jgi:hypothetical protein
MSAAQAITVGREPGGLPGRDDCLRAIALACESVERTAKELANEAAWLVDRDGDEIAELVAQRPDLLRQNIAAQPFRWSSVPGEVWQKAVDFTRKDHEHIPQALSDEELAAGIQRYRFDDLLSYFKADAPAPSRGAPVRRGGPRGGLEEGAREVRRGPLLRTFRSIFRAAVTEPAAIEQGGYVNTGFCELGTPGEFLRQTTPLRAGGSYWLGVEIGRLIEEIAVGKEVRIDPQKLPQNARLTVVLFSFDQGLRIENGADQGEIELDAAGYGRVTRQPGSPPDPSRPSPEGYNPHPAVRLLFPVKTDETPGKQRVRCSFYCNQVLVHSRVITARVTAAGTPETEAAQPAISFKTDYLLARSLSSAGVRAFAEHDVSLLLNDGGDGTHQLRVFGKHDVKEDVQLTSAALGTIVEGLRAGLRTAAWGKAKEWDGSADAALRYTGAQTVDVLRTDLIAMARAGRRSYDTVRRPVNVRLKRGNRTLEELLERPAYIQFASRGSVSELVPCALFYDRPLDPNLPKLSVCPAFELALRQGAPLWESACWADRCPSRGSMDVVCPSGFWGFRHYIGVPLTMDAEEGEASAATDLGCVGDPAVSVSVSTDPMFVLRQPHLDNLRKLCPRLQLNETRDTTVASLAVGSHVSYFYCHGDMVGPDHSIPALLVGPNTSPRIDASIISQKAKWKPPGPLVFLNGCHTAALLPSQAFDLVAAFIQDGNAAGVIGTEITVYEALATRFGEEFLRGLLVDDLELGVAVRRARLVLLKEMNPLGLAYTPFALSRLRLRRQAAGA